MNIRRIAAMMALIVCAASTAGAQGPLTAGLPEGPPALTVYRIGPIQLTPNLTVREIGVDDNVFDEAVDPKRDFMFVLSPEMAAYVRSGLLQAVIASGTDFTYYHEFKSERSIARQLRGRLDFLLSRFRPSIGAAVVDSRQRPNAEIDLRAERSEREVSATLAFELSPLARIYAGAARYDVDYNEGEVFRGVDLDAALDHRTEQYQGGVRFALTPFTTLTVEGVSSHDRFASAPLRDSDSGLATAAVTFGSEAIISGTARLGYRAFSPVNARLEGYRGFVTSANLTYTAFWRARLALNVQRDVQYSFDEAEGYFVGTTADVTYTQRFLGPLDFQVRAGRGGLDYGRVQDRADRADTTTTYGAGLGYNRDSGARFGLNYEHSRRDSDLPDRRFTRRKLFGSLTYRF